jgi:lysophospholipase L1-like esterase
MQRRTTVRMRLASVLVAFIVCGLLVGSTSPADAQTAAKSPTDGLEYVALGDSFAAGYGLSPATKKPVSGCHQSSENYPHRVARALGLKLTDVTCSGAVTADVIARAQKTDSGRAPVQLAALGSRTRVVTLTIGGNDLGFFTTATSCIALTKNGPILTTSKPNCKGTYVKDGVDTLAERIPGVVTSGSRTIASGLVKTYAAIREAAPKAKVFVIGYPAITPDAVHTPAGGCFRSGLGGSLRSLRIDNGFPFTDGDSLYLNAVEKKLDAATKTLAEDAGFQYISVLADSEAHSACASPEASYLQGLSLRTTKDFSFTIVPGALHPNAKGAAFLANSVIPQIRDAFPTNTPTTGPSAQPSPTEPGVPGGVIALVVIGLLVVGGVAVLVVIRRRRRRPA